MKYFSILLLLFLGYTNSYTQEEWLLERNDGKVIKAELTKKGFYSISPKITYINKATGKKEKVNSSDLVTMTSIIEGDTMVYKKYKQAYSLAKNNKYKFYIEKCWAAKIYETDKMEVFFYVEIVMGLVGTSNTRTYYYAATAIKLPSDDFLIGIAPFSENPDSHPKMYQKSMNKALKKILANHCPTFANGLHKLSYDLHEYKKIADDYSATCK